MAKFSYSIKSREIMVKGWSSLNLLKVAATDGHGVSRELRREVADHGDGAAVLPVDYARKTVLLVRQWRAGAAFGGHEPFLIEACAGLLDADNPSECVRRETFEELGTHIHNIKAVGTCYSSPGAVSERLSLFLAEYGASDRVAAGGGLAQEDEDIEVLELGFDEAFGLLKSGKIEDAKTIILLQMVLLQLGERSSPSP